MEYLSLYEYLGRAAGSELGKQVAAAASQSKIKLQTRHVSNPKYTGDILLYPKDFLESYFREDVLPEGHDWTGNLSDDDLPF